MRQLSQAVTALLLFTAGSSAADQWAMEGLAEVVDGDTPDQQRDGTPLGD